MVIAVIGTTSLGRRDNAETNRETHNLQLSRYSSNF